MTGPEIAAWIERIERELVRLDDEIRDARNRLVALEGRRADFYGQLDHARAALR